MARRIVGVIGAGECDERISVIAEEVGCRLAECQCVVLTGGLALWKLPHAVPSKPAA